MRQGESFLKLVKSGYFNGTIFKKNIQSENVIKNCAIKTFEKYIGSMEKYEPLIKIMIPTVIDNLIDVEKGKIKLNKQIKHLCCGCF